MYTQKSFCPPKELLPVLAKMNEIKETLSDQQRYLGRRPRKSGSCTQLHSALINSSVFFFALGRHANVNRASILVRRTDSSHSRTIPAG